MDDPAKSQDPAAAAGDPTSVSGSLLPASLATTTAPFNPSRMVGIIKRKALIKNLATVYHTECLSYCQELLELQRNSQEPFLDSKTPGFPGDSKEEMGKPPKRVRRNR